CEQVVEGLRSVQTRTYGAELDIRGASARFTALHKMADRECHQVRPVMDEDGVAELLRSDGTDLTLDIEPGVHRVGERAAGGEAGLTGMHWDLGVSRPMLDGDAPDRFGNHGSQILWPEAEFLVEGDMFGTLGKREQRRLACAPLRKEAHSCREQL